LPITAEPEGIYLRVMGQTWLCLQYKKCSNHNKQRYARYENDNGRFIILLAVLFDLEKIVDGQNGHHDPKKGINTPATRK
jgi:hypothetical protein